MDIYVRLSKSSDGCDDWPAGGGRFSMAAKHPAPPIEARIIAAIRKAGRSRAHEKSRPGQWGRAAGGWGQAHLTDYLDAAPSIGSKWMPWSPGYGWWWSYLAERMESGMPSGKASQRYPASPPAGLVRCLQDSHSRMVNIGPGLPRLRVPVALGVYCTGPSSRG